MFKRVVGTKDILPEEAYKWRKIEEIGRNIFSFYNYQEIRTPLIEEALLFNRSLGKSSEIVQKQMFLINPVRDYKKIQKESMSLNGVKREKGVYALRPEGTAPIVRAYIENALDKTARFIKLYYIGPMFRAERPQKGRLRQFHHLGCEVMGSSEPEVDIEILSLSDRLLREFKVVDYKIKINSLGCAKDKLELTKNLHKILKAQLHRLCHNCRIRFKHNTLRILDCKNETCQDVIKKLDIHNTYLCADCKAHFTEVKNGLDSLKIDYEVTPHLVRGLDYYTRSVFEIIHKDLGAQDALAAGGRYDNLIAELGGSDLGAMGFAFGIERLLLVSGIKYQVSSTNFVYIISLGKVARKQNINLLDALRKAGITSDTDYENKSLKAAMRKANDLGARYVLIMGEDELKKNVVTLKDMVSGEQKELSQEDLLKELKNKI